MSRRKKRLKREAELARIQSTSTTQTKGNTVSNNIKQKRDMTGLLDCTFDHEIAKTTVNYKWNGPKITREVWNEVLAFFRWTFTEHGSESQVRMFVHPQHGWRAWAFPQRERTGMAAQELDVNDAGYERTIQQRAMFNPDEGWMYFATVHHHCAASAFQSGTDEANERSQDGIHITVGNMGSPQHSIDVRMYYCGFKLGSFDMSWFWDVGNELELIPAHLKKLLPDNVSHMTALNQMGIPAPAETTFNATWKENVVAVVKVVPEIQVPRHGQSNHSHNNHQQFNRWPYPSDEPYTKRCFPCYSTDLNEAIRDLKAWFNDNVKDGVKASLSDVLGFLEIALAYEGYEIEWLEIALKNDVNLASLHAAIEQELAMEELKEQVGESEKKSAPDQDDLQRMYGEGGWS